jgi:hypothetical protein
MIGEPGQQGLNIQNPIPTMRQRYSSIGNMGNDLPPIENRLPVDADMRNRIRQLYPNASENDITKMLMSLAARQQNRSGFVNLGQSISDVAQSPIGMLSRAGIGAGAGATLGYLQGATPEQRRQNAIMGAFGGAGLSLSPELIKFGGMAARGEIKLSPYVKNTLGNLGLVPGDLADVKGETIARKLGVNYNGIQEGFQNIPDRYMFTDNKTKSSFMGKTPKEAKKRLQLMREKFEK